MTDRWTHRVLLAAKAHSAILSALLFAITGGCATTTGSPELVVEEQPRFEVLLKPMVGEDGEVMSIAVESVIHGDLLADAGPLSLAAPVVYAGAYGIADRVKNLSVSDHEGIVSMSHSDDPQAPGGFPYFRHWKAERDVTFPVTVTYRTEVEQPTDRRGPPFNIRPTAGGVSGAGSAFLVIPENVNSAVSQVSWDLDQFEAPSAGISSFGEDAFELAGPPAALMQGWFMAGPVGRYPAEGDANGFSAAWLGDYPFDAAAEMKRAGEAYTWLGKFFEYLSPPPRYRVFMRIIESKQTGFSGTALNGSFMLSGGPNSGQDTDGKAPRGTFFHEMIHMWVGGVEGPQGVSSWFSEGLTSYYTLLLPVRAGSGTDEEFEQRINQLAENYYNNPAVNMSASDIAAVGFGHEDTRRMPYYRGALYFADLDAQIRQNSADQRNLDVMMREIFYRRQNEPGFTFDHDSWMQMLNAELGEGAGQSFTEYILEGVTLVPASAAFGPCFERRPRTYVVESREFAGYEWIRKPKVPDEQCRSW